MDPYTLNLRHLFMVNAIGRTGSITAACALVHLSQPALTQGLANLEKLLGCRLFERERGGVSPNEAGRLLITRMGRASELLNEGVRPFRGVTGKTIETHMTMAQMRALIAIPAHGGFALAARATGLSQPSIHRAARELEDIVGQPLFLRAGRTVQLTQAASRFSNFARLAMAELRSALAEIAALTGGAPGRIVIGSMPLARSSLIPSAVAQFFRAGENTLVSIVEGPYDELLSGLRTGEIDLLLGAVRAPNPAGDVVQHKLFEDRLIIAGRHDHPLAGIMRPSLRDLSRYPWVISRQETPLRMRWEDMFASANIKSPPVRVECSSVMAIRGLLLEGDWLTLLSPEQIRLEKASGLLIEIGKGLSGPSRWIGMTTRRDWLPTHAQKIMADLLKEKALSQIE